MPSSNNIELNQLVFSKNLRIAFSEKIITNYYISPEASSYKITSKGKGKKLFHIGLLSNFITVFNVSSSIVQTLLLLAATL